MKVYIGPYTNWIGPYQIAEKLLFWKDRYHPDYKTAERNREEVHKFGEYLSKIPGLTALCQWIDSKKKRKVKVHIDGYDCWSADETLAMIIVPVLEKLKQDKHGSPGVDDEDVPEHLRTTNATPLTEEQKNCGHTDDLWEQRWEWVLDEIIWAFRQHAEGWKDQYYSGESDIRFEKVEGAEYSKMVRGPNDTFKVDREGIKKHQERMNNGRRLFAKYYECLWD